MHVNNVLHKGDETESTKNPVEPVPIVFVTGCGGNRNMSHQCVNNGRGVEKMKAHVLCTFTRKE